MNSTIRSLFLRLVHLMTEFTFSLNQIGSLLSFCPSIRILQLAVPPSYIYDDTNDDFGLVRLLGQCPTLSCLDFQFFSGEVTLVPIAPEQVVDIINHQAQSSSKGLQQLQFVHNNDRVPYTATSILPLLQKTKDTLNFLEIDQSTMTQYFYTDRWDALSLIEFPCPHKLKLEIKTINSPTLCQLLDMYCNVLYNLDLSIPVALFNSDFIVTLSKSRCLKKFKLYIYSTISVLYRDFPVDNDPSFPGNIGRLIDGLPELLEFSISGVLLSDPVLQIIASFKSLKKLTLQSGHSVYLKEIDTPDFTVTQRGLLQFINDLRQCCTFLQYLELDKFTYSLDDSILPSLGDTKSLKTLVINNNISITDTGMKMAVDRMLLNWPPQDLFIPYCSKMTSASRQYALLKLGKHI